MFDLPAYLDRIGCRGRPGLAQVHRAHATTIPFENLDPQRGVPVELDTDALQGKLVVARRGGYCFEHNLLFAAALRALGMTVEPMLGRVLLGPEPEAGRPRSHLALRVTDERGTWLADVGFGADTLLEPIPFEPGGIHAQSGWRYRAVARDGMHVLQMEREDGWENLYGLRAERVPLIDIETSNWYTATHPSSRFVTGLIVAVRREDGSRLALSDWFGLTLTDRSPTRTQSEPVERAAVPELLASRFGLEGFGLGPDGRIIRAT
jgi:N-hydroxyarylamine O-acetyltransferase